MSFSWMCTRNQMREFIPWGLGPAPLSIKCKFDHKNVNEILKIMLPQHAVRYHKANDCIWLQDQQQPTYQSLFPHCQLLKTWCEQFHKAKEKGQANLTSLTAATASSSSIHQDTLTAHPKCPKCDYPTPRTNAQPTVKSATIAVACITTQPCVEDPGDLIIPVHDVRACSLQNIRTRSPQSSRTSWNCLDCWPRSSSRHGQSHSPSRDWYSSHSNSWSLSTNHSYQSPSQSPQQSRCSSTPTTRMALM